MDSKDGEQKIPGEEEEEAQQIDPITLKPDLYNAATLNNTEKVFQFLDLKVPPTYVDMRTGLTALHWASMNGNVPLVKRLIENGACVPYQNFIAKLRKDINSKNKKSIRSESRLNSIVETPDDIPTDELKDEMELDEDEDEFNTGDDAFEVKIEYNKNTPLLWASHSGHLRIVWLLLSEGYSPNDVDKMGNNALHLAAAYGDFKILQVLINDGANANAVNHYKNLPLDMAKNKQVRDMLRVAMEVGASMTDEDRINKHENNLKQHHKMSLALEEAVAEAEAVIKRISNPDSPRSPRTPVANNTTNNKRINRLLSEVIAMGNEYALDADLINTAEILLKKIEIAQDLSTDIEDLQKLAPMKTQYDYLEHVYKLEKSIERAKENNVDQIQIQIGLDLIARCQIEYWLLMLIERLKDIESANDSNEHDMNKLRDAVEKAETIQANAQILSMGNKLLKRMDAELGMNRALKGFPVFKTPMDNPPEGYYTEKDIGKIQETEGYPLPPPETNEYIWLPSETLTAYNNAIIRLKGCFGDAENLGANPLIIAESKERLTKAEKEIKLLEAKDLSDKNTAIELAKKLAKKLKAKKKKEKA